MNDDYDGELYVDPEQVQHAPTCDLFDCTGECLNY